MCNSQQNGISLSALVVDLLIRIWLARTQAFT